MMQSILKENGVVNRYGRISVGKLVCRLFHSWVYFLSNTLELVYLTNNPLFKEYLHPPYTEYFFPSSRICRTRTSTGMRNVSCATSARCPSWTNNLDPRWTRYSVALVMTPNSPRAATAAERSSGQVSTTSDFDTLFFLLRRWFVYRCVKHIVKEMVWFLSPIHIQQTAKESITPYM